MRHIIGVSLASLLLLASTATAAYAVNVAYVHGRNNSKPSTSAACDYWGGCSCSTGNNSTGRDNSGWCWFAGGPSTSRGRTSVRYDASRPWWGDSSSSDPICDVAAQINAINDSSVRVVGHSAGGMVTAALLTNAANGWGSCSTAIQSASNKITYVAAVSSPFRGTKAANAVYGHVNNSGNPLTDWLHNFCGNTIGGLANLFADQASPMTYELQTGVANTSSRRSWLNNSNGKPFVTSWGTTTSGNHSVWLAAAVKCLALETPNDGLTPKYSARGCNTAGSGGCSSGSDGRPSNWSNGVWAATGHSSNRRNNHVTSNNSSGYSHAFAQLLWFYTGI
jgi:hypothetical protein